MSDIDSLLAQFDAGTLVRPSARVPNIVDLAKALAHLAGVGDVELTPGVLALVESIGAARHLVFVLADGLGMNLIEELPPSAFLRRHLRGELRTVFPSTTATALTALATGTWPSEHAVTGQWTHLPEISTTGALLPFASRAGGKPLGKLGLTPEQAFPVAALAGRMVHEVVALFPEHVATGVSSAYFAGKRRRVGYRRLADAVAMTIERVTGDDQPTYTYIYSPSIDGESHRHGVRHRGVEIVVGELQRELERLADGLAGRARLVVSADHGMLDTPSLNRHWIRSSSDIFALLRCPPSGDSRVMYLHVRDGQHDLVRRRIRERFGHRFHVITVDEAETLELLGPGPLSPATRARIGDLVVISAGLDVLEYVPGGNFDRLMAMSAHHSGLSSAEMRVPLVIV